MGRKPASDEGITPKHTITCEMVRRGTVGSLFSGVGGLDLGLALAGWRHEWFCEIDGYCREVLDARWPGVPCYEDVRYVDGSGAPPDLICGGFPCQDVSVAGQRRGLAGERSGLFHEAARVIDAFRPRWVLIENVPGLFSSNGGRDFGVVLGTLADLGYSLAWRVLDSRYFGVPQRRRRVFIVGALAGGDPRDAAERAGQVLAVSTRCDRHSQARGEAGEDAPVASLSGLGNGGPDDNDGQAGRLVAFHPTQDPISSEHITHALSSEPTGSVAVAGALTSRYRKGTDSDATDALVTQATSVRRLTPTECERLQGFPDGWTDLGATKDSPRYQALGNAVTVTVAEWIGERILRAHVRGAAIAASHHTPYRGIGHKEPWLIPRPSPNHGGTEWRNAIVKPPPSSQANGGRRQEPSGQQGTSGGRFSPP